MELFELIEDLRVQLQAAANQRSENELSFGISKIEMEVGFVVERRTGAKIATKLVSVDDQKHTQCAHKIRLELSVGTWRKGSVFELASVDSVVK